MNQRFSRSPLVGAALLIALCWPELAPAGQADKATAKAAAAAVSKAARCYAQGDMLCVLTTLQAAPAPAKPELAAERARMLAMAAGRMDRQALAVESFVAWIRLNPAAHRLARATTAPGIYRAWAAAWMQVHKARLDLQPRGLPEPAPLPGPVTAGDLPRFSPPPRSKRDKSTDTAFALGLAFAPWETDAAVGWLGLHFGLDQQLGERASIGVRAAVMGRGHGPRGEDSRTGIGYLGLAPGWSITADGSLRVAGILGFATSPDSFVGGATLRYDHRGWMSAGATAARPYVEVTGLYATERLVGQPLLAVAIGVMLGGVKR